MRERCQQCFNLDTYCTCVKAFRPTTTVTIDTRTDFKQARDRVRRSPPFDPVPVTPRALLMDALDYDPSQDGLILCPKCGVTWDYECDYGGWHDETMYVEVSVPWMEEDDWGRHL